MGLNDRMSIDPELAELLEEAIESGRLSSTALRIAHVVLNDGFGFLTDGQTQTFDRYVQPTLRTLSIAKELRRNREMLME